jgi:hypothetical protein
LRFLEGLAEREEVRFFDLNQGPFQPAADAYFDGCDHLGPEGAEALSRVAGREILAPVLRESESRGTAP